MTKLSQCAKCKKDRRICGFYTPEDDTDCPHYMSARQDDGEDEFMHRVGIGYTTLYVGFAYVAFSIGFAQYFKNPVVYYIFAIPVILLVVWGILKYVKNRKKTKQIKTTEEDMEQVRITLPDTTTRTSLMEALRKLNLSLIKVSISVYWQIMTRYGFKCRIFGGIRNHWMTSITWRCCIVR